MSLNPIFLGDFEDDDLFFDVENIDREYREHFVAFLDILGFKSLIQSSQCKEILSILRLVREKTRPYKCSWNGMDIEAYEHIHYRILSDSIILFIEADIDDSFAALLDVCEKLQIALASLDNPILLRGGISKGNLYYEMDIIYGGGLTAAYLLESNLAKYPRIVFLGETLKAGIDVMKYMNHIKINYAGIQKDVDGVYFIDYFAGYSAFGRKKKEYFDKLIKECVSVLDKSIDVSVRDKYSWMMNKINNAIIRDESLRERYDKEKEEREFNSSMEFIRELKEINKKSRELHKISKEE